MPPNTRPNYFDPVTLNKIDRLEVRARAVVEGFISGLHRSPYHGFSVEFAEYREYVPGDDIKHIDWKVWGRSDRFFLKQYEEETNLRSTMMLDCSKSMAYGEDGAGMSKFDYGATLMACLSLLLQRQQDAIGAVMFDSDVRRIVPPRANPRQAQLIINEVEQCEPDNRSDVDGVFSLLPAQLSRRGIVVIISDLFLDLGVLETMLQQFGHARHEVVLFHVLHEDELTFPFDGNTQFRGLEVDAELLVDAPALKKSFLQAMEEFQREVRQICGRCRCDYVLANTGTPLDVVLSEYLTKRMAVQLGRR